MNEARRARFWALLVGGPAVVAALGLSALELWRWADPGNPLFARPVRASLADAIAADDARAAYAFIRAGQDPNRVLAVSHPVLTGGRTIEVPPLVWAVAMQSDGAVGMLLGFGGRLDADAKREAICLARRLESADILQLLQRFDPETSAEPCPTGKAGAETPLLTGSW